MFTVKGEDVRVALGGTVGDVRGTVLAWINRQGQLEAASRAGQFGIVRLLLERGANIDTHSALEAAARAGHIDIVQLLLEHGADLDAQRGCLGTLLHAAASQGYLDIVQLLLEHGVPMDSHGGSPCSAFEAAAWGDRQLLLDNMTNLRYDIARRFLEHVAEVNGVYARTSHAVYTTTARARCTYSGRDCPKVRAPALRTGIAPIPVA